ncbi:hypothetical protein LguiA_035260 [Lonicera macranthoides]
MDSSLSSSVINKSVASSKVVKMDIQDDDEESGWTSYFEDFLSNQRIQQTPSWSPSCNYKGTTLVSDAASYVHRKFSNHASKVSSMNSLPKFSKKLNFSNKTRAKEIYYDDSLEDTASSPVNSPKVDSLKETDMKQRKTNDLVKGVYEDHHLEVLQREERFDKSVLEGKNDNERQELGKGRQLYWLIS